MPVNIKPTGELRFESKVEPSAQDNCHRLVDRVRHAVVKHLGNSSFSGTFGIVGSGKKLDFPIKDSQIFLIGTRCFRVKHKQYHVQC